MQYMSVSKKDFQLTFAQAVSISVRSPVFLEALREESPINKKNIAIMSTMFEDLRIHTVGDLISLPKSRILNYRGIGHNYFDCLHRTVKKLNLGLGLGLFYYEKIEK